MRHLAENRLLALATIALLSACDAGGDAGDDAAPDTSVIAADTSGAAADATADERFLRQMADHHEGLILMAQRAQERAQDDSVSAAADALHRTQVEERDSLLALLTSTFATGHTPQAMARHRAQADSITGLPIDDHDRYFLASVIAHHREGVAMIGLLEPSFENAHVRELAETIKASLQAEIAELEAKRASL